MCEERMCLCMRVYGWMNGSMYAMCVCVYVCMYVCMSVYCMYTVYWKYACIHVYRNTHRDITLIFPVIILSFYRNMIIFCVDMNKCYFPNFSFQPPQSAILTYSHWMYYAELHQDSFNVTNFVKVPKDDAIWW